jgi:hypothetical protein
VTAETRDRSRVDDSKNDATPELVLMRRELVGEACLFEARWEKCEKRIDVAIRPRFQMAEEKG